jgi:hypothetical protein
MPLLFLNAVRTHGAGPDAGSPLGDKGGPPLNFALLPGSPAINAGDNASCPPTDQRGMTRPQGPICDSGAFEFVEATFRLFLPVILR